MADARTPLTERFPASHDAAGVLWVKGKVHHVWILPRPPYCDRGHWIAHVEPAPGAGLAFSIDESDLWPRFYMDEDRMLMEIRDWLDWREGDGPKEAGKTAWG